MSCAYLPEMICLCQILAASEAVPLFRFVFLENFSKPKDVPETLDPLRSVVKIVRLTVYLYTPDAQGRALLEEDLRSPCTEEIAAFQAFSPTIREAGNQFVVMDTAPTGHTLLLLDATGAYLREIAKQMDSHSIAHYTTPMMQLQNPKQTKMLLVTLAEITPVLEAAICKPICAALVLNRGHGTSITA